MYKRTFELLSKFVSTANNVTIQFDMDGGAKADMKNNILHLPKNISSSHAYAAISLMMHESAHIKHSKIIPIKDVVKTKAEFSILNAIEDIRIDIKNFDILPNIWSFYEELIREVKADIDKKLPVEARALCWSILHYEGFEPKNIFGVDAKTLGKQILDPITYARRAINMKDWVDLRNRILEIKKILNIPPDPEIPQDQLDKLQMGDAVDGPLGSVEKILRPEKVFKQGQESMDGASGDVVGGIAMDELYTNQFKEILNVKEKKVVDNGMRLDTNSLVSFKTGEVNELFKEDKIIKKKKSKVMFLLDGSGSMDAQLLDGTTRLKVVTKSVKKLTEILDEVSETEGLNVDWGVGMFRRFYFPFTKDNWQSQYSAAGGTDFAGPFQAVMQEMIDDYTIDGKRIIIVMTDGEVEDREINEINETVMRNYNDVRSLIIGVGASGNCMLVKKITGDNIILAEENAVPVIMETIKALL
jgi:uncharacterized protein YegL